MVIESGMRFPKDYLGKFYQIRCDFIVAETDVYYPMEVSVLWDAMRFLIHDTGRLAQVTDVGGWRQWKHLSAVVKTKFNPL